MEQNKKNDDCYFYYYSNCTKVNCQYRHEPSALGCETMCKVWQQGNCNVRCRYRHMELKKNRKTIPCYWEKQSTGCKKKHCPFLHMLPRTTSGSTKTDGTTQECNTSSHSDTGKFDASNAESDQGRGSSEAGSFSGIAGDDLSPIEPKREYW